MSSITSSVCVSKGDSYSFGLKLKVDNLAGYSCEVSIRDKDTGVVIDSKSAPLVDGVFLVQLWPEVSDILIVGNRYILAGTIVNDGKKFAKTSARQIEITEEYN